MEISAKTLHFIEVGIPVEHLYPEKNRVTLIALSQLRTRPNIGGSFYQEFAKSLNYPFLCTGLAEDLPD